MKRLSCLCGVIVALAIIGTAAGQAAQAKKTGAGFQNTRQLDAGCGALGRRQTARPVRWSAKETRRKRKMT